ncbi:MAG TPA: hypothetical protein VN878_07185 [Usitatibacter sp.]|nr:hypothetical protein [Usitatibacter sp.]
MDQPSSDLAPDDAQRRLEQHALRNVRELVDRIEKTDKHDRRTQRRLLVAILVGVALVLGLLVWQVTRISQSQAGKSVVIESTPLASPAAKTP